ncbi:hypothetical protein KM043_016249 [Ampulex compressa]|nr:hypothetical protein KM043_016249 [Ampulex compressa]
MDDNSSDVEDHNDRPFDGLERSQRRRIGWRPRMKTSSGAEIWFSRVMDASSPPWGPRFRRGRGPREAEVKIARKMTLDTVDGRGERQQIFAFFRPRLYIAIHTYVR